MISRGMVSIRRRGVNFLLDGRISFELANKIKKMAGSIKESKESWEMVEVYAFGTIIGLAWLVGSFIYPCRRAQQFRVWGVGLKVFGTRTCGGEDLCWAENLTS